MDLNILRLTYFLILKRRTLSLFSLMERSLIWYCQLKFVSTFTNKYLTLSVGYSLLPHNLISKSPSNFFYLDLKITISVFFTLSEILFAFNQFAICFKSALTSLISFLAELLRHKRLVSSAKWRTLQNFIAWLSSFIYSENRVLEQILQGPSSSTLALALEVLLGLTLILVAPIAFVLFGLMLVVATPVLLLALYTIRLWLKVSNFFPIPLLILCMFLVWLFVRT